jgi:hypothetical protein
MMSAFCALRKFIYDEMLWKKMVKYDFSFVQN